MAFLLWMPSIAGRSLHTLTLPTLDDAAYIERDLTPSSIIEPPSYQLTVQQGDILGLIFSRLGVGGDLTAIQEADKNVLSLDVIKAGDQFNFWVDRQQDFDNKSRLTKFEQVLGIEHQVIFRRKGDGFEYKETILEGSWQDKMLAGRIENGGNLSKSAYAIGLSAYDADVISRLLKRKIDFGKVRAGDTFQVLLSAQYLNGQATGNTKVEAVRFINNGTPHAVFAYKGSYYDSKGEGLERAFSRRPVADRYRISSNFNPKRRHPITRLIRPHNGTDFAVPKGTPIYSPGEGVVRRVVRHKYAGLYIEIQHNYQYRTRYLHLSKALVRKGQTVKRGQKIALSGNTGRSTGPHLHYEFHVNQKPVNPMGKKVPIALGVDRKSLNSFKRMVSTTLKQMDTAAKKAKAES
ncbi:MAG: peptidoglycan DD-metalloendopeptidase family protein [Pseudomonadales bacterium]